jgi:hypothetical protein
MTSLHELQSRILDALLSAAAQPMAAASAGLAIAGAAAPGSAAAVNSAPSDAPALFLIDAPAPVAAARLAVYRNTVLANVTAALRSTYPAIWRLVGEAYFGKVAHDFIVRHPSTCGDLTPVGAMFPEYLTELHRDDEYAYLGDVARFEWLTQEALLAADHPPFDLTRLGLVAPAEYDGLRFVLHPALRRFESRYPVRRIWESNVGDAEPECIDLAAGGDRLALLPRRQLQFHPLTPGEWCWLDALEAGMPFAASVEAAVVSDGSFDAAAALRRFVRIGAIVDF